MSAFSRLSISSGQLLSSSRRVSALFSHLQSNSPARTMASQSIPQIMKGVIIEKNGGADVLQYKTDLPVPTPKEGQILVRNDYVGVNYIDT